MSELNIYQRINAVMKKVDYLKKDTKVQGYTALTHDAVTAAVRAHFLEIGIVLVVSQVHGVLQEKENPQAKMRMYDAKYEMSFVNIDSPDDKITMTVNSNAADNGDKAPGKAMSYAVKYALLKLLMIETGDNDESRTYDKSFEAITAKEYENLKAEIKKTSRSEDALIEYVNSKGGNFTSISELNNGWYTHLMGVMQKKPHPNSKEAQANKSLNRENSEIYQIVSAYLLEEDQHPLAVEAINELDEKEKESLWRLFNTAEKETIRTLGVM